MIRRLKSWYASTFPDAVRLANENLDLIQQRNEAEEELREARELNESLVIEKLRLQDRCEFLENDRKELWGLVKDSLANERAEYRANENVQWQMKGYGIKYPDAPSIERKAEPDLTPRSGTGARQLLSDVGRRKTQDFLKEMGERVAAQARDAHIQQGLGNEIADQMGMQ